MVRGGQAPVTLRSHDGLKLHGWLLDPDCSDPQPHLYAICCHGYAGEPAEMAKWAHRYAQLGFTVLLPAQRAHELSEGRYVGMGLLESDDLLGWVSLITAADPDARILLHGNSMGAATVMMAAGDARLPATSSPRFPIADTVPWSRSLRIMPRRCSVCRTRWPCCWSKWPVMCLNARLDTGLRTPPV